MTPGMRHEKDAIEKKLVPISNDLYNAELEADGGVENERFSITPYWLDWTKNRIKLLGSINTEQPQYSWKIPCAEWCKGIGPLREAEQKQGYAYGGSDCCIKLNGTITFEDPTFAEETPMTVFCCTNAYESKKYGYHKTTDILLTFKDKKGIIRALQLKYVDVDGYSGKMVPKYVYKNYIDKFNDALKQSTFYIDTGGEKFNWTWGIPGKHLHFWNIYIVE